MPILKIKAFQTSDGSSFATVVEAQKHELAELLRAMPKLPTDPAPNELREAGGLTRESCIAEFVLSQSSTIVDILTMKPTSHPKARSSNGATRKRTKPSAVTAMPSAA